MIHTLKWFLMIGLALLLSACNGDNPPDSDMFTYYLDSDRDGYGDPGNATEVEYAEPPVGYVDNDADCDDANAAVNPEVEEVCDEVDNNCNGEIDEGVVNIYYADRDGDGHGNAGIATQACSAPADHVQNNTDCDDTNAAINPDAEEVCDQVDNNCSGETDEGGVCDPRTYYRDADADAYGDPDHSIEVTNPSPPAGYVEDNTDCDDTNAAINPNAEEVCDQVDNNCSGEIDEGGVCDPRTYYRDADADAYGDPGNSIEVTDPSPPAGYVEDNTDCDDTNAAVHPGAEEIEDGVDNNCNGEIDEDNQVIPLPPSNVSASDIDSGLTHIAVSWNASDGATSYNVYRAIWEEDAEYELVAGNIPETSYDFVQDWQTDVYNIIGPNPAMAPDADEAARAAFIAVLEVYRENAQPVLYNFKAPAYFKIEACNDHGCSEMSDFDAGQAEFIHTATESEVAQLVIPLWGYPNLKALADSPPGVNALEWCGIDICGSVEGMVMGRLDRNGLPQVDVYYENYVDGWDLHPNARFWADGYIGGEQRLIPALQGVVEVSGEFDVSVGPINAHMFVYSYTGGTTGNENDGYVSLTYKGNTHQFTLPVHPVEGQDHADPPVPVVPARDDEDYTIDRRETNYPVPFSEQPNRACARWSDDKIVYCNRVP
jgi:hypothetical protein